MYLIIGVCSVLCTGAGYIVFCCIVVSEHLTASNRSWVSTRFRSTLNCLKLLANPGASEKYQGEVLSIVWTKNGKRRVAESVYCSI